MVRSSDAETSRTIAFVPAVPDPHARTSFPTLTFASATHSWAWVLAIFTHIAHDAFSNFVSHDARRAVPTLSQHFRRRIRRPGRGRQNVWLLLPRKLRAVSTAQLTPHRRSHQLQFRDALTRIPLPPCNPFFLTLISYSTALHSNLASTYGSRPDQFCSSSPRRFSALGSLV